MFKGLINMGTFNMGVGVIVSLMVMRVMLFSIFNLLLVKVGTDGFITSF